MNVPEAPKHLPLWLWQTKRLFPHPLFAGCISLACALVGILFAGIVIIEPRFWPVGFLSVLFLAGSFATAAATSTRLDKERLSLPIDVQTNKPTFAIVVLLISIYSIILTLGMHVFEGFFNNGPASTKYYVTLGIAISSALYMQIHGKKVVREHFGSMGGRKLELTGWQSLYVVLFMTSCVIYAMWLIL